jgi:hypothetical protein
VEDAENAATPAPAQDPYAFQEAGAFPGASVLDGLASPAGAGAGVIPGGGDPSTPPVANAPSHTLIPTDSGGFTEIGEDGVPLGEWIWDEAEEQWIFDEFPPLGDLPQTRDDGISLFFFALFGLSCAGMGVTLRIGHRFGLWRGAHYNGE